LREAVHQNQVEAKTVKGIPEEGQITSVQAHGTNCCVPSPPATRPHSRTSTSSIIRTAADPFAATGSYQQWLNEECTGTLTLDDTYHFNDPTTAGAEPVVHNIRYALLQPGRHTFHESKLI